MKQPQLVYNIDTDLYYESISKAERAYGNINIRGALDHPDRIAGGYHWIRVSNEEFEKIVGKMQKPVYCIETGEIFVSITAAAKRFGLSISTVQQSLELGWAAGGYHWAFFKIKKVRPEGTVNQKRIVTRKWR